MVFLLWLPSVAAPQDTTLADAPAATIDYGFCGGKPVYPVIGVNFATFCGPRNQISLGRRGQLMWSFPGADSLRMHHEGVRKLTEEELTELQLLAEAAQVASPPEPTAGTARYELGISFVGRPTQRAEGVLAPDGSSAMALIDALRRLTPAAPLMPKCRNAPLDAVFSPTMPPAERRAAPATAPRHPAKTARAAAPAAVAVSSPLGSRGITVAPAKRIRPHTLVDQDGADTVFPAANGRWQIVIFGYTNCPDVCPMTLHKVVQALNRLGPQARGLEVVFVSIDSERDQAQQMKAFVHRIDVRITGLTADPDTLKALADEFGVLIRRYQGGMAFATLQHSSLTYLLDPQGSLHRLYPAGTTAENMADELAQLLPAVDDRSPVVAAETSHDHSGHQH